MRSKNVVEIQKYNMSNPEALKEERNALAAKLEKANEDLERYEKRFRSLEGEYMKLQNKFSNETTLLKEKHLEEKENLKS